MSYIRDRAPLEAIRAGPERPILLSHGCVLTGEPALGDWTDAGVLVSAGLIVGVGPGLDTAAADDGMIVVDCRGCVVMPANGGRLVQAEPADVAVFRIIDPEDEPATPKVSRPSHVDILLARGRPVSGGGRPTDAEEGTEPAQLKLVEVAADAPRIGLWSDQRDWLRQRLLPNGRYDEARGERESAYCGRYWIDGDRIDYLDDIGFWSFGTFVEDRLEHAGYTLRWSK
ncbi:MAG: Atu4866 domain-containing protein [Sphingobium sp.]|nr:Atu4866 domain-containing protein [Sphingobium sp.]